MDNMMPLVVDRFEAAKLLGCEVGSIDNLRRRGVLKPIKDLPGVKFARRDIESLVGIEEEYSPFQYRLLKDKNEQLKNCIKQYKKALSKVRIALEVNAIREVDDI